MSRNKKKKGGKIFIAVICIILALCIGIGAVGLAYWNKIKNAPPEVEDTMVYDFDADETIPLALADDPEFDKIFEGENAADLRSAIKNWVTDDTNIMYSENVINILCIGVDTRNKNTISGLTDSMIVVSINKKLGTITFTSIMRDSYAYLIAPDGTGSYNKINSAFPFYGIDNLISTIQSHFKIRIDGYAMVNFALFKVVIDKLGGVEFEIPENMMYKNNSGVIVTNLIKGKQTLNGKQFLQYIRYGNFGDAYKTAENHNDAFGLMANPLWFVRTGAVNGNGSLINSGNTGFYLINRLGGNPLLYFRMSFTDYGVTPSSYDDRYYGFSVRCMASVS